MGFSYVRFDHADCHVTVSDLLWGWAYNTYFHAIGYSISPPTPCVYVESLNVDVATITITVTITLETKNAIP